MQDSLIHVWPYLPMTKIWSETDTVAIDHEDLPTAWSRIFGSAQPKHPLHKYTCYTGTWYLYANGIVVTTDDNDRKFMFRIGQPVPENMVAVP